MGAKHLLRKLPTPPGPALAPAVRRSISTDVSDPGTGQFRRTLHVMVSMSAVEPTSDFTSATGSRQPEHTPLRGAARQLRGPGHVVARTDTVSYVDTDHAADVLATGNENSFVSGCTIVGDTGGDEAGTETRVTINHQGDPLEAEHLPFPLTCAAGPGHPLGRVVRLPERADDSRPPARGREDGVLPPDAPPKMRAIVRFGQTRCDHPGGVSPPLAVFKTDTRTDCDLGTDGGLGDYFWAFSVPVLI